MKETRKLTIIICVLLTLIAIACGTLLVLKLNNDITIAQSLVASTCINYGIISKLF